MATQKDIKSRIGSVKNIRKITRAMEMVAAARLRRAEQRIEELRPYADAIRKMTRRAVEAAERIPSLPILEEHDSISRVGNRRRQELEPDGKKIAWYASGRRGVSSVEFRGFELSGGYTGFTDRPTYADARNIADDLIAAYVDGQVDRVEMFYNGYVSPMTQEVRHETLLPLQQADVLGDEESEEDGGSEGDSDGGEGPDHSRALWIYEPGPEEI